jgi:DNA methyltransferase 1-associated protein 1
MSEDLKDILTISGFITDPQKKKKGKKEPEQKKKPDMANREVLSLTNGLFPVQPSRSVVNQKNDTKDKNEKTEWTYHPIVFGDSNQRPTIYHWVAKLDKDKTIPFMKFNVKPDLVKYTDQEYELHIKNMDSTWTKEETDYLWEMCERYDLRFLIIYDRYNSDYKRGLENLKERYYNICKKILEVRGEKSNPLKDFTFDTQYERNRKFQLEKFLMRSKDKTEEEKKIIEDLRKLENVIKREEKEQKNLQTIMKLDIRDDEVQEDDNEEELALKKISEDKLNNPFFKRNDKIAYLRSSLMHVALPISARMNKKLNLFLSELNIPPKPIPTAENETLYDKLRENVLKMFSLQKHLKKKELEKKRLEELAHPKFEPPMPSMPSSVLHTPTKMDQEIPAPYNNGPEVGDKRKNPYADKEKANTTKKLKIN